MDFLSLGIVALVCLAIGFLGGILINALRGEKKSSAEPPIVPVVPVEGTPSEYTTVAEFLRQNQNGPLLVKLDGKIMGSEPELNSDERACLEDLLLELRTWLGYKPFTNQQLPADKGPDRLSEQLFGGDGDVFIDTLPIGPAPSTSTPPFTGSKSIVGQIDDILQEKLAGTPLASKRIRLMENPSQGVVVQIGLEQFSGIDGVPDPEIRNLIHESVSDWETRAR